MDGTNRSRKTDVILELCMLKNTLAFLAQNRSIKFAGTFPSNHHENHRLSPGFHRRPGCCHSETGDPRLRAASSLHGRSVRRSPALLAPRAATRTDLPDDRGAAGG